jgi:hypothetical protein
VRTASIIIPDDGGSTHFTRQYIPEDNSEHLFFLFVYTIS